MSETTTPKNVAEVALIDGPIWSLSGDMEIGLDTDNGLRVWNYEGPREGLVLIAAPGTWRYAVVRPMTEGTQR